MREINIEFECSDGTFYFSHRKVFGQFTMYSNHFQDQFEIYYLLSGERHYFIKDRVFHIKPGSLVLINEHDLHKTTEAGTEDHGRILINFSRNYLPLTPQMEELLEVLFRKNNNVVSFFSVDQQHIETLLDKMTHEIQNKTIGYEISLQALLMDLMVYTTRYIQENCNNSLEHPSPMHEKISEVVQYINNNYNCPLCLPSVSKRFFISQYYLSRAFKQSTGFTFVEYVNSVRIREAQRLLRESEYKIIDIAEKVGFRNVSHFGRVFKEITSFSPLNYRKLNKL